MKRKRNIRKKKNNLLLLILLVVGLSVGFAFVSSNISINGIAGINSSVFDIHWENVVPNSASTVTAETPGISEHATKVSFSVNLALPGDFYEFDVDAKNDGDWAGTITEIDPNIYKVVEDGEDDTVPSYIKTSIVYKGTDIEPKLGDVLYAGEKQTYTIRVEYDKETDELPDEDFTIKVEEDITYSQWDTRGKYLIKFDPNGGNVVPSSKEVEEGGKIGSLPTPMKEGYAFIGWFTGATDGTKIDTNTVPVGNVTYYAHWTSSFATFDTGENVNVKFKTLANPSATISSSIFSDTNVTAIRKSDTEPTSENKTSEHIVSIEGSTPIYAWFENGTIYWYTDADYVYLNQNSGSLFYNFTNATVIDTNFITSNVVNMSGLFSRTAATSLDLSNFDTGNVTNMIGMFGTTSVTSLDLSSFDTSKVTDMNTMFAGSKAISINLSSFDTKNVQNMSMMFSGSSVENLDLGGWNIENVSSITNMFAGSKLVNLDMSGWHYKKVNALSGMFSGASFLRSVDMSDSNFESIQYFSYVFQGNGALQTVNLDNVDTSNITSLDSAFQGCSSLTNLDLSDFETSNLLYMSSTFQGCSSLTSLDLTSFDTLNVIYMSSTFQGCSSITTITVSDTWTTANVQGSGNMFQGCVNLVGGNGTVYDSNHIDKEYAHYDYGVRDPGYFNRRGFSPDDVYYTVTFNPNGGEVDPTTKQVRQYDSVGQLPTPTNGTIDFDGWYTKRIGGTKVTASTVPSDNATYYAHWFPNTTVTFDANEGVFNDNKVTNVMNYVHSEEETTKYSHTPNISDEGVQDGVYDTWITNNDVVTIEGSDSLDIELWYSTGSQYYDWLAIYPKGITPDGEYTLQDATISNGKLYGGYFNTKPSDDSDYHKHYIVNGDTAQFYFKSEGSSTRYYGYYAIINGINKKYTPEGEYKEPLRDSYEFLGWNTEFDGSGTSYKDYNEVFAALGELNSNTTLYAQWKEKYTIEFDPNGGHVDEETRVIYAGEELGVPPLATNEGYALLGWYTELIGGIEADSSYIPSESGKLFAHWASVTAKFDIGKNVNVKMKTLAGDTNPTYGSNNTSVIEIKKSTFEPDSSIQTAEHIVSAEGYTPIYAWFDNGTIYWWTSANKVYLNEDASYMFNSFKGVTNIDTTFDTSLTNNMSWLFSNCTNLPFVDTSNFNTRSVTDMSYMFYYDTSITSLDLSNFDTANVSTMYYTFGNMTSLTDLNISNWDFRKYTANNLMRNMTGYNAGYLKRLIMDNTIYPQDMSYCFRDLSNLEYLSLKNVDTSRAATFDYMFYDVKKLTYMDLSDFDTGNVYSMGSVFYECSKLKEVNFGDWDTRNVANFSNFFYDCYDLEKVDLSSFETDNASGLRGVLNYCNKVKEVNLSNWNFSKYSTSSLMSNVLISSDSNLKILILNNTRYSSNMYRAFGGFRNLEILSIEGIDTSNVTNMGSMFEGDTSLKKLWLNDLDTTKVTDMSYMFSSDSSLQSISVSDSFVVGQVTSHNSMFSGTTNLVGGAGTVWNTNFIDKARAHYDKGLYNPGYFNDRKVDRYKVTFNANGGLVTETTRYVWSGDQIGVLPVPTRGDDEFLGWYVGYTDGIEVDNTYVPTSNITLVARWSSVGKYEIQFDPNGGTVSPAAKYVIQGNAIGDLPTPTKPNSVFEGWYTSSEFTTKVTESYVPDSDKILIAKWRDPRAFTITFDANGGTVSETTRTVVEGRYIGELPPATWENHYFAGWYTEREGGNRISTTYKPSESVTLYAHWKNIYTITFNANGGTVGETTRYIVEGQKIGTLPTPEYQQNRFAGWYNGISEGIIITEDYVPTSSQTLWAHWQPLYTVTFDPNGGTVNPGSKDVIVGEQIGNLPTAKKEGNYVFTGWYRNNTKIDYTYVPDGNVVVSAAYEEYTAPTGNLEDDDWKTISGLDQKGIACSTYNIGDTKTINMGEYGTHTVRLANCSEPIECSSNGFSQTACGVVFEFTDILVHRSMNPASIDSVIPGHNAAGGWEYSDARAFLNSTIYTAGNIDYSSGGIYNSLPSELKRFIAPTYVVSGHQITENTNYTTYDYLYLLSPAEIYGVTDRDWARNVDTAAYYTRQFDYYRQNGPTINNNQLDAARKIYTGPMEEVPSYLLDNYISCDTDNPPYGTIPAGENLCRRRDEFIWWTRTPLHNYLSWDDPTQPNPTYSFVDIGGHMSGTVMSSFGLSPAFKLG